MAVFTAINLNWIPVGEPGLLEFMMKVEEVGYIHLQSTQRVALPLIMVAGTRLELKPLEILSKLL